MGELTKGSFTRRSKARFVALLCLSLLVGAACAEDAPQDYLRPEGRIARETDQLWDLTFFIAVVIFFVVEGLLVYALVRFRHKPGRQAADFHGNTKLEVALTAIPALILAGLAVPTVAKIAELDEKPANALEVTVTGRQFWWEYEYPDLGVITANELHIPVGKPVYVTILGADVNHSFWVPKLAGAQDVVPGRINHLTLEADKPGVYLGQCKEFCGLSHSRMRLRVIAQTPSDFDDWVSQQQAQAEGASSKGAQVFIERGCAACHAINGLDGADRTDGKVGPDLTHFASRETFAGAILRNTPDNLARWLRNPPALKAGVDMPNLGLSEDEVQALVEYLETLE